MGVIRGGKAATEQYLRNMDRMIESQPHFVYVLQDKRALHDYARTLDVELALGDEKPPEDTPPPKGAPKEPSASAESGHESTETGPDGARYQHKYIKRYKAPSGNWVYVYHTEGAKRTGFSGEPEVMPAAPPLGQKRKEVSGAIKERARMKGGKERKQAFAFHDWVRDNSTPESTQSAVKGAVAYLGGGSKGMGELKRRHDDWMAKNPHLTHPDDKAFAGETLAREVMAAHQHGEPGVEPDEQERSRYAGRPGGFTPKDPGIRQAWQLTRSEFSARQKEDPKLQGQDYEKILAQAGKRGEYIPTHVLGQSEEKDPEFSARMHDFKNKFLKENKPKVEMSPETEAYIEKFDKLTKALPKKFDGWVKADVRREGDKYLNATKASGYNIDSYDVSDAGVYSHMMTAPETLVLYHQYAEHADHGKELLAQLHEHGIDCEYTVVKRASAVAWNNEWPDEDEMEYRETGEKDENGKPKRIGYSSDYVLAFRPRDNKQAESIAALLHEHAHAGEEKFGAQAHQAIHRSWYVPDVRSSKKIDGYGRAYLNVKTMGHQELCILTKNDFIKEGSFEAPKSSEEARYGEGAQEEYDSGFRREYVYVDQSLHDVIKAMRGLGKLGHGEVVIVDL